MNIINYKYYPFNTLFCFLLLFINISFSEDLFSESSEAKIDSLYILDDATYDSLKTELSYASVDTAKIKLMNRISWHLATSHPYASIIYADSAIELSHGAKWLKGVADGYNNKAEALRYQGLFLESINNHKHALEIFQGMEDELEIAKTESSIGICYFNLSEFTEAYEHFDNARSLFEAKKNYSGLSIVSSHLGIVFSEFKQYEKALNYFHKSLRYSKKINNESTMAIQYNNIAITYEELKDYKNAIKYYDKAMKIFDEKGDRFNFAIALGNIGIPYTKLGEYSKANKCFNQSLKIANELKDNYGIAHQYGNLGELYLTMGKDDNLLLGKDLKNEYFPQAVDYFKLSVDEFEALGAVADRKNYLKLLSDTYSLMKDYKNSLKTYRLAMALKDSLQYQETQKIISNLEINQELEGKKNEIFRLNQEKSYQAQITAIVALFFFFVLFVAVMVYYLYVKKKKSNLLLEENIKKRMEVEEILRKNEIELKSHKNNLERLVRNRTKELENEILEHKETEEALLSAIERTEIANNAKSVFLANMSHELRTPLVGILGYSDLLISTIKNEEAKEMAEGINRTGNRLLNTLSLILDLARIESDKFEIEISTVDIIKELKDTYLNFKAMAEKKNLKINLNLHSDKLMHDTDVSMIKVILDNLVNNAIKFTEKGEITIMSDVDYVDGEAKLLLKVMDTGVGIKKKDIPLIFEEFKQLSEGLTKDFQGSGLGLSITKKFVELLGGKISVNSEIGRGSTFTIAFPLKMKAAA